MKVLQKIIAIILLGGGFVFSTAQAQTKYTLSGVVADGQTGETLPGAYVLINGQQRGTSTNGMGYYKLQLEPGEHTLVATFVGYRPDTVRVTIEPNNNNEYDFNLIQEGISGEEITVTADRVIRRVQNLAEKRNEERKNLKNYSAKLHKLAILYQDKEDVKETKQDSVEVQELSTKVSENILWINSTDSLQAIAFSERVIEQLFVAPKMYAEKYLARRASKNFFSEYDIFSTGGSPLNLNEEKVELNILTEKITVVGPISTKAGEFYNVEDEPADSTWPPNTTRINVDPKTSRRPLFKGSIYVNDDADRVIGMNLELNKGGNVNSGLYSLTGFKYYQRYQKIKDEYWLPMQTVIEGKIGIIGMKKDFIYRDYWTYEDYQINRDDLTKSDIPLSGQMFTDNAANRDSTYWNESVSYSMESQVQGIEEAIRYTEDRAAVNAGLSLMRAYFKAPTFLRNFYITNVSDFYRFNKVEGHFLGAGIRTPSRIENFTYKAAGGYATDQQAQDWRYHFDMLQYLPGTSLAVEGSFYKKLAVQFGDYVYDRNPLNIDQFRYDLIAGLSGFDPRNFFERDGYRAGLRYKFGPKAFLRANYLREDHNFTPIVTTGSFFDDFEIGGRIDPNLNPNVGLTPNIPAVKQQPGDGFTEGEFSGFFFQAHYDNRQFVREGLFRDYEVRKFGWYTDNVAYWSDPDFGAGADGFNYFKYRSSFGFRMPAARSHFILGEFHIGASNNPLPAQSQIGSNGFIIDTYLRRRPFITLGFNEGAGNRTSVARLDYDFGSSFFRSFPFEFIRQSGMQMRVHATAGYTHDRSDLVPVTPFTDGAEEHVEAGFAVTHILGLFKVEASFRLAGDRGEKVGLVLFL